MINGCDVSAFQPANPAWGTNAFAWVKATEGVGWESPVWKQQIASGRSAGLGMGYYHYCDGRNTPQAEAQYYWGVIKGTWQTGEPIALDVEGPFFTYVSDPVARVLACAQELYALSGLKPVFYSDWSHIKSAAYNWQPLVDYNMGLWGAAYNPTGFGDPSPWPAIFCWQNADTNVTGGDSDVLNGDLATWRAYGTPTIHPDGGITVPLTQDDANLVANTLLDMQIARGGTGQTGNTSLRGVAAYFDAARSDILAAVKSIALNPTDAQIQALADKLTATLPPATLAALKAKL